MKQSVVMRTVRALSCLGMLVASSVIWAQGRGGGSGGTAPAARPSYTNWEQYGGGANSAENGVQAGQHVQDSQRLDHCKASKRWTRLPRALRNASTNSHRMPNSVWKTRGIGR